MRVLLTVITMALLVTAAHAQGRRNSDNSARQAPSPEAVEAARKQRAAADKAYKAALDKIPNKPAADPWGSVRPGAKPAPAATVAKKKPKPNPKPKP